MKLRAFTSKSGHDLEGCPMSMGVPGGQKGSTVKDPDRTSLPSKLPKTISVSFIKSSLHFTNILCIELNEKAYEGYIVSVHRMVMELSLIHI